jgi:hypothetical protein
MRPVQHRFIQKIVDSNGSGNLREVNLDEVDLRVIGFTDVERPARTHARPAQRDGLRRKEIIFSALFRHDSAGFARIPSRQPKR